MPNWKKVVVSGSDALLNTVTTTGDIIAGGNIYAEQYVVSSSVTHMTQSFSSGSTIFGDTIDDTHIFTGSLFITGVEEWTSNQSPTVAMYDTASGEIYYSDNPSLPSASIDDLTAVDLNLSGDGTPEIIADGALTLSSSGAIIISGSSLEVNGPIVATSITASISSSNIQGTLFTFTDGTNQGDITFEGNTVTSGVAIVASASGLSTTDNVEFARISASGHLFASTSDAAGGAYFSVLVNTESGQFYYTASATGQDTDWTIDGTDDYIFNTTAGDGSTREVVISSASATIPSARKLLNVITDNSSTDLTADIDSAAESGMLLYNNNGSGGSNDKYANIDFKAGNSEGRFAFQQTAGGQGNFSFVTDNNGNKLEALRIKGGGDINVSGSVTASLPRDYSPTNPLISYDENTGGFYKHNIVKNDHLYWKAVTGNVSAYSDLTGSVNAGEFYFNTSSIDGKYYAVLHQNDFNDTQVVSSTYWRDDNEGAWMYLTETGSGKFKRFRLNVTEPPEAVSVDGTILYIYDIGHQYDGPPGGGILQSGSFTGGEMLSVKIDKNKLANDIYTPFTTTQNLLYGPDGITSQNYNFIDLIVTESVVGIGDPSNAYSGGDSFNLSDASGFTFLPAISVTSNLKLGNITSSAAISASGHLFASTSNSAGNYNSVVVIDTASGQFYYTGSYGGTGGGVTSVATGDGLTGGPITTTGTVNVDFSGGTIVTDASLFGINNTSETSDQILVYKDDDGEVFKANIDNFKSAYDIADVQGTPSNDQIAVWTDSDSIEGTSNLIFNTTDGLIVDNAISASGHLFASTSNSAGSYNSVVVIDTASGQFYYTGSYGSGGGTTIEGTNQHILYFNGNNNADGGNTYGEADFQYDDTFKRVAIGISSAGTNNYISLQSSTGAYSNNLALGSGTRPFFFDTRAGSNPLGRFSGVGRHLVLHRPYQGPNQNSIEDYPAPSRLTVSDTNHQSPVATFINLNTDQSRVLQLGAKVASNFQSQTSQKFIEFTTQTASSGNGTAAGSIEYNPGFTGNAYVIYYGNFSNPSDKNLKKNIVDTKFGVNDLMKFKVKDFNWKKAPKETPKTTGLIAQEVQEIFPNLVSKSEDRLHLKTNDIVPMLIKAVQDQQKEIEELKQLIKDKLS